jgi:hypothetical protein
MERTRLLNEIVTLDARIMEATVRASISSNDLTFEKIIEEIRALRKQRSEVQAKLDALG